MRYGTFMQSVMRSIRLIRAAAGAFNAAKPHRLVFRSLPDDRPLIDQLDPGRIGKLIALISTNGRGSKPTMGSGMG
jgi:hypothetical protein